MYDSPIVGLDNILAFSQQQWQPRSRHELRGVIIGAIIGALIFTVVGALISKIRLRAAK